MNKTLELAWRHPDYAFADGIHEIASIEKTLGMPSGSSVIDFGCGQGVEVAWLNSRGHFASGIDIVNHGAKHTKVRDLTDPSLSNNLLPVDYGLCLGVLDHMAERDVPVVIANIGKLVKEEVFFTIPIRDLGWNALLGRTIQKSIKPIGWWRNRLQEIGEVRIGQPSDTDWMWAHVRQRS